MNAIPASLADLESEERRVVRGTAPLVGLHFMRAALRRRLGVVVLSGLLGMLAAGAYLAAFPVPHKAQATLILAHDPQVEPMRAMATDVSLLTTRAVAARAIEQLGSTLTPEQLLDSLTVEPAESDVLVLTLAANTPGEAVQWLSAFTGTYLTFRGEQLGAQSEGIIEGTNQRIAILQRQVEDLESKITAAGDAPRASDLVAERAQVSGQITTLQETVQDTRLRTDSIVAASRVIDPAARVRSDARLFRAGLTMASGLIVAVGAAAGIVLFLAITSDRVRRRSEIAAAVEAPVAASTGRLAPLPPALRWLPHARSVDAGRRANREHFARALVDALPESGRAQWLAVACVQNVEEVRFGVAATALQMHQGGRKVHLTDLTDQDALADAVDRLARPGQDRPVMSRPHTGIAGPAGALVQAAPDGDPVPTLRRNDVSLALMDVHLAGGVDRLAAWTEDVIVVVSAGRSSAERVRTIGDLVRAAGMRVRSVLVLDADDLDESSGLLTADTAG